MFVVAVPGRAYLGKPRLLHLQGCFLDQRQAPGSYRGIKIQICSHAAEINVKDGGSHPDCQEDSNHATVCVNLMKWQSPLPAFPVQPSDIHLYDPDGLFCS